MARKMGRPSHADIAYRRDAIGDLLLEGATPADIEALEHNGKKIVRPDQLDHDIAEIHSTWLTKDPERLIRSHISRLTTERRHTAQLRRLFTYLRAADKLPLKLACERAIQITIDKIHEVNMEFDPEQYLTELEKEYGAKVPRRSHGLTIPDANAENR